MILFSQVTAVFSCFLFHTVYAADGAKKQKDKPLYSDSKNICTPQTLGNSASPMLFFYMAFL